VVGSGYWVYADQPGTISEASPLDPRGESRINFDTESAALDPSLRGSTEVVVVRPGMVYANGSWCRAVVDAIMNGRYSYVGDGSNAWSFVSLEDAGSGFARVAEAGRSGEVYNLVDGRPAPWREFGNWVAERLGQGAPPSMARDAATAQLGPDVAHHLSARRACSAAKLEAIGWKPRFREFRAGMPRVLEEISRESSPGAGRR
jgi:nucleoside-diphosphate-sugar epimerase